MRILVTGATGFLGRHLVPTLTQLGHQVIILSRSAACANRLFPELDCVTWPDAASERYLTERLAETDAVVHLAGETIAKRWTAARKRRIYESRVETTRTLIDCLASVRERPVVFIGASAVGIYGPTDEWVSEEDGPGNDFLARVVVDWEAEARRARNLGLRVVHLRTGVVLSREGGLLQLMLQPFRLGLGGSIGSGRQWLPWIHVQDWVNLVMHVLSDERAAGPINAVAPAPVRMQDFAETLGRVLNRSVRFRIPAQLVRLALGEMSMLVLTGQRVLPLAAERIGYDFNFPLLEPALRDLLAGMRDPAPKR